jgi:hypothetical protein
VELSSDDYTGTSIQKCSLLIPQGGVLLSLWALQVRHLAGFAVCCTLLIFNAGHRLCRPPVWNQVCCWLLIYYVMHPFASKMEGSPDDTLLPFK